MLCWLWNVRALWRCSQWAISIHQQCNVHKRLLCYAQEDINKNLLLSVNESSKQTWDAGLKIDIQYVTEEHCGVFKWASLVQSCLCVTECESTGLWVFVCMQLYFYCNKLLRLMGIRYLIFCVAVFLFWNIQQQEQKGEK